MSFPCPFRTTRSLRSRLRRHSSFHGNWKVKKLERTTRSHVSSSVCSATLCCDFVQPRAWSQSDPWITSVKPSERHFVIRERATGVQQRKDEEQAPTSTCNAGAQQTVLPNTMEKKTTWSPPRKKERGIHEVTLLDDEPLNLTAQ